MGFATKYCYKSLLKRPMKILYVINEEERKGREGGNYETKFTNIFFCYSLWTEQNIINEKNN